MIYTNNHRVPREIADAVIKRSTKYKKLPSDEYSVTEILNPPRQIHLTRRHFDEIEVDVSQLLYSHVGHLLHDDVQTNKKRFMIPVEVAPGEYFHLSGEPDIIEGSEIRDLKYTSVWSVIFGDSIKKWKEQLNVYAFLFELYNPGQYIDSLTIIAQFRDWSENQALSTRGYPKSQSYEISIPVWSTSTQDHFVHRKLYSIYTSQHKPDAELPLCPDEDRWIKAEGFALMRRDRKRAIRVLPTMDELYKYCEEKELYVSDDTYYVEERKSKPRKCQKYCHAAQFCSQYQNELEEKAK